MTSLAIALSVDQRGPCALYIITDSRITWGDAANKWDSGKKTFASSRFPDVFGYCGDAFFPPMMLSQIIEQLDAGLLCGDDATADTRTEAISSALALSIDSVAGQTTMLPFAIYHGAREREGMQAVFRLWEKSYDTLLKKWEYKEQEIKDDCSYLVHLDGSGARTIARRETVWKKTDVAGTSRAAIWAVCESLQSRSDSFSGGSPQLVGLWRKGSGKHFGFFWQGKPYLGGLEVLGPRKTAALQWFNHLFERCDADTGRRIRSAKKHIKRA